MQGHFWQGKGIADIGKSIFPKTLAVKLRSCLIMTCFVLYAWHLGWKRPRDFSETDGCPTYQDQVALCPDILRRQSSYFFKHQTNILTMFDSLGRHYSAWEWHWRYKCDFVWLTALLTSTISFALGAKSVCPNTWQNTPTSTSRIVTELLSFLGVSTFFHFLSLSSPV